jgi:hypothetical protein
MAPGISKLFETEGSNESLVPVGSFDTWIQGLQLVLKTKAAIQCLKVNAADESLIQRSSSNDDPASEGAGKVNKYIELEDVVEELGDCGPNFVSIYPVRIVNPATASSKWLTQGIQNRLTSFISLTFMVST